MKPQSWPACFGVGQLEALFTNAIGVLTQQRRQKKQGLIPVSLTKDIKECSSKVAGSVSIRRMAIIVHFVGVVLPAV